MTIFGSSEMCGLAEVGRLADGLAIAECVLLFVRQFQSVRVVWWKTVYVSPKMPAQVQQAQNAVKYSW